MLQAIDNDDKEQVRHQAHILKGMAANLSGLRLQQQASLVEVAAKKGDMNQVIELMPGLLEACEELKLCFEQYSSEQAGNTSL